MILATDYKDLHSIIYDKQFKIKELFRDNLCQPVKGSTCRHDNPWI